MFCFVFVCFFLGGGVSWEHNNKHNDSNNNSNNDKSSNSDEDTDRTEEIKRMIIPKIGKKIHRDRQTG